MIFDPMVNMDYGYENVMEAYHQLDREGKLKIHVHGGYQVFGDKNPVKTCEPEKISDAKIICTMIGGEEVYTSK